MGRFSFSALLPIVFLAAGLLTRAQDVGAGAFIPARSEGWEAAGKPKAYDRTSVYDYLDGGAEVYLAYGLKRLWVQNYQKTGETPLVLNLFEMQSPAGAFGAFTFEREDEEAGIGQGSEYGGGILRFWQGSSFAFLQAERESPAARSAMLGLGRLLASRLGPPEKAPALPGMLPSYRLRSLSVRYVLSPQLLESVETSAAGGAFGFPKEVEAVVGRYGPTGDPERVLVARLPDLKAAAACVERFLKSHDARPGEPFQSASGWSGASASAEFVVVVLDAHDADAARAHLRDATKRTMRSLP